MKKVMLVIMILGCFLILAPAAGMAEMTPMTDAQMNEVVAQWGNWSTTISLFGLEIPLDPIMPLLTNPVVQPIIEKAVCVLSKALDLIGYSN